MRCPFCNSESNEILKSKGNTSKDLLLKCNECGNTFRETVITEKPVECRVVVSEYESSEKKFIKLYPYEKLQIGQIIEVEGREAEITSLETKRGGRIWESPLSDVETIWASYIDTLARVGVSVDFGGRVVSKKVEVDRDFEFEIGDIVKLENLLFRINSLKTMERKMRKGFARASVTKRVYGRPIEGIKRYKYDLSSKVVVINPKNEIL